MKRSLTEINATYRLPQPGELNEHLQFRKRQDVPAADGGTQPVYTEMFKTWARVRQVSGSAYQNSMQTDEKITHVIVIRRRSGITNDMEVIRDGSVYRVMSVGKLNDGKQFLRVNVKELGAETSDNPQLTSTIFGGYGYGR